jgi:hypothetical protein
MSRGGRGGRGGFGGGLGGSSSRGGMEITTGTLTREDLQETAGNVEHGVLYPVRFAELLRFVFTLLMRRPF